MLLPGDIVKFNNTYSISESLRSKNYVISSIAKFVGQKYIRLKDVDGFFPYDSVIVVKKAVVDWEN